MRNARKIFSAISLPFLIGLTVNVQNQTNRYFYHPGINRSLCVRAFLLLFSNLILFVLSFYSKLTDESLQYERVGVDTRSQTVF